MSSHIWRCYSKFVKPDGKRMAQCNTCSKHFSNSDGNTTTLWRHLEKFHPELLADAREIKKNEQEFLKLVAEWIVSSNQPFSAVENPAFLKMMGHSGKFKPPSRYTLTQKILPSMEKDVKQKIKTLLIDQRPSLTADVWEQGDVALVAITGHFIDAEFIPRNAILGAKILQGAHTSDNIQTVIEECLDEYGISESAAAVTTDAAAVMVATVRKMGKANIVCCAHQLHLVVTDALSCWSLDGAISQCRKFSRLLHKSAPARRALRSKLEAQTGPNKCPIRGVPRDINVRWNSTYLMIEAVVEKIDIVNEVLEEFGRDRIADEDALQLQKATKLLKEFYLQTLNLSADFTPATEIIPILTELIAFCDTFIGSSTGQVVDLAVDLRNNLRYRLSRFTSDSNLLSLMMLDPRFAKDEQLVPSSQHAVIRTKLEEWFRPSQSTPAPTARPANGATNKFKNLIAEREAQQPVDAPSIDLEDEIDRYLAELTINKVRLDSNPLEWWKVHQYLFPNLALAAREALALQATSVQSERLFSKIGLLYQNKLRNRLQGESVERSALIACAGMPDIARKLSCERVPSVSLRKEGEALKEDEEDGENDEETVEREIETGEVDVDCNLDLSPIHDNGFNDFYLDAYQNPTSASPPPVDAEVIDPEDFFASL